MSAGLITSKVTETNATLPVVLFESLASLRLVKLPRIASVIPSGSELMIASVAQGITLRIKSPSAFSIVLFASLYLRAEPSYLSVHWQSSKSFSAFTKKVVVSFFVLLSKVTVFSGKRFEVAFTVKLSPAVVGLGADVGLTGSVEGAGPSP